MDKNGPNWNEWVIKKWKRSRVKRWFGDGGGSVRQHRDDKENTQLIQGENVQRINKKEREQPKHRCSWKWLSLQKKNLRI